MSILKALDLLPPILPQEVMQRARDCLSADQDAGEITFPGFSIWKVPDALNLLRILQQRVRTCPNQGLKEQLEKKMTLVSHARSSGRDNLLWQAYLIVGDEDFGFIIDLGVGEVAVVRTQRMRE